MQQTQYQKMSKKPFVISLYSQSTSTSQTIKMSDGKDKTLRLGEKTAAEISLISKRFTVEKGM